MSCLYNTYTSVQTAPTAPAAMLMEDGCTKKSSLIAWPISRAEFDAAHARGHISFEAQFYGTINAHARTTQSFEQVKCLCLIQRCPRIERIIANLRACCR